jgi:hypothetical protein
LPAEVTGEHLVIMISATYLLTVLRNAPEHVVIEFRGPETVVMVPGNPLYLIAPSRL